MKSTYTLTALVLASSALLGGCASTPSQSTQYSTAYNDGGFNAATNSSGYGVIENIQVTRAAGSTTGTGAVVGGLVGALVGNQVGSGTGRAAATVAGAVGGAAIGNNVEGRNANNGHDVYQISVRLDNGDYRTI
ncbi:MAG: glycine zipper 2TM domain-containing protein, partial [Massilia sp.]